VGQKVLNIKSLATSLEDIGSTFSEQPCFWAILAGLLAVVVHEYVTAEAAPWRIGLEEQ
jgi:hypothetical protein